MVVSEWGGGKGNLWVVDELLDGGEELVDQLAALAEPLTEQRMGINLWNGRARNGSARAPGGGKVHISGGGATSTSWPKRKRSESLMESF